MPKGPFVADAEAQSVALRDALVQDANAVGDAVGDVPFGAVEMTAKEQAVKFLPAWFVLGQAADEVSVPWWTDVAMAQGPADASRFDRDMRRYWENEEYRKEAMASAPPELADVLHFLVSVGLHTGQPRPQAKDSHSDASHGPTRGRAPASGTPTGSYA